MEYRDPDGYYFLQELWLCSENGRLDWTYFAPEDFKVLLYFPQTGEFVSGGIERAYAYDSYYTASFTDGGIALERSYDYTDEAVGFAVRCVLTIAIELAMAYFAFRLREKRQVAVVAAVNAATQGALNLALNLIAYFCGGMAAMLRFFWLELLVFAAEGVLYRLFLRRGGEKMPLKECFQLSAAGNICSFLAGLVLAFAVPGIF